jgi:alcohol dehydrogenase
LPDQTGPDRAGPDRAEPDRAGPDRAGPDRAGPDRAGNGTLRLPGRLHFGFGVRAQLPSLVGGRRVLAVVDPFLKSTPFYDETVGALGDPSVFDGVTPELPVGTLDAALGFSPEVVVGIGGGSTLDAAKLIALLISHGGPLSRYYGENLVPGPTVPVIALPTTAGTGSEVTPVAVVSDPGRELKVGISSPYLVPSAALVDPELTMGSPRPVTAFSGIDALVHAIESYTARRLDLDWSGPVPAFTGRNLLAEPVAREAAGRLLRWLPVAVDEPDNREARHEVARGALQAGIAFGSTGTHLCHALQYPIGALTGTPHGLGTGLLLPYVIEAVSRDREVAARLGSLGEGDLVARVAEINRAIGVPATLAAIGVRAEQLPRIAELALTAKRLVGIAPVEPSHSLLLDVLERAHAGVLE